MRQIFGSTLKEPEEPMHHYIIDSGRVLPKLNLKEIYQYRELLSTLAYRDIKVKYAQTILGIVWALLQPLILLMVMIFVFNKALNVETPGVPYPIFTLAGMASWRYFANLFSNAGTSLVGSQNMIKKIYFPRLIIPLSKSISGFIDFAITLVFMAALMIYYGYYPGYEIIYLPLFIIMTIITGLSIGIWLSALTIRYRDFQHMIPFLVQIGYFVNPVAYPITLVPEKYLPIYFTVNPVAGVIEGFRWSLVGGEPPVWYVYISFSIMLVIFVTGLFYFKKVEKTMADLL